MTWKEFKDFVNKELVRQGRSEDIEIEYIDITLPDFGHERTSPMVLCSASTLAIQC